jgi:hypothetical protein
VQLLAGIGITIAVQQLHVVLGGNAQSSLIANLAELPAQLVAHHPGSVLVGILTVVILLVWPRLPKLSIVPAPLVAVVGVTVIAATFMTDVTRVSLPDEPLKELIPPTLPAGGPLELATAVLTVALVASVESLLSAVAVDKLHRGKRANLDRELVGQGAANAISGALGGMPVTGVIVRSSTNVAAGARSRASAILHGVWIAVFVLAAGAMLELIPMAALAGILLVTGLRPTSAPSNATTNCSCTSSPRRASRSSGWPKACWPDWPWRSPACCIGCPGQQSPRPRRTAPGWSGSAARSSFSAWPHWSGRCARSRPARRSGSISGSTTWTTRRTRRSRTGDAGTSPAVVRSS